MRKPFTKKHCLAISKAIKSRGQVPWNKGKRGVYSAQTLTLMRTRAAGRSMPSQKGKHNVPWQRGKTPVEQLVYRANIIIKKARAYVDAGVRSPTQESQ